MKTFLLRRGPIVPAEGLVCLVCLALLLIGVAAIDYDRTGATIPTLASVRAVILGGGASIGILVVTVFFNPFLLIVKGSAYNFPLRWPKGGSASLRIVLCWVEFLIPTTLQLLSEEGLGMTRPDAVARLSTAYLLSLFTLTLMPRFIGLTGPEVGAKSSALDHRMDWATEPAVTRLQKREAA